MNGKQRLVKNHNISVSDEAWAALGRVAKGLGTSRSAVIELMAKQMDKAEDMPVAQYVQGIMQEVLEIFKEGNGPGVRRTFK